jgi:hypothetical protein
MNTDTTKPPLEPWLIPDAPGESRNRPSARKPAVITGSKKPAGSTKPVLKNRLRKRTVEKFTLEDAYTFTHSFVANTSDLEKAIRATAFLLAWASEGANEEPDGYLAFGLTRVLERCANQVGQLFTHDDIERLGSTPQKVREARSEPES